MATTPNYSWPTPDDTDLVRDGAAAIRALGSAVDTTVFANSTAVPDIGIDDLNDVSASSPSDGDLLVYSSAGTAYVSGGDPLLPSYREALHSYGTAGTALTVDLENGPVQSVVLGDDVTVTVTGEPAVAGEVRSVLLLMLQDGTGSRSVTWFGVDKWFGEVDPSAWDADEERAVTLVASSSELRAFVVPEAV
jgi:hypothetical protein